jgi:hypothetical protein
LTHRWKISSIYWCKHLNISTTRRMKSFLECWSQYDTILACVTIITTTPPKKKWLMKQDSYKSDYVCQSVNTFYYKHNIHSSIDRSNEWKNDVESICICLCKTWNLTSLAMKVKKNWITSCVPMRFPPWAQQNKCIHIKFMAKSHIHR